MVKEKNRKSIIVAFSLSPNYIKRIKDLATRMDISLSGLIRRAFDDFEYKTLKKINKIERAEKSLNKTINP